MNRKQKNAIDTLVGTIARSMERVVDLFLDDLQLEKVINFNERQYIDTVGSNQQKWLFLIELLKQKSNGWISIITYLEANGYLNIVGELIKCGGAASSSAHSNDDRNFTCYFINKLNQHFTSEFSCLPTMFGCHKNIKNVWVPLRIKETTYFLQKDNFDHVELLKRLAGSQTSHVALVQGDPGVGKTTLLKKIAYDWANGLVDQFSLVLVVPLRYVGKTRCFLEMAADYYATAFKMQKPLLLNCLKKLGHKLLVCLDGLDEYHSLAQSPLKTLFAKPFGLTTPRSNRSPPPFLSCKLLITSRPYACDLIHRDFFPLRFEIFPLDEAHLVEFIQRYCATPTGVEKVTKHLEATVGLVIQIPLILTFICTLADLRDELPNNLTLLYERFLSQMIQREIEDKKLKEKVDIRKWKESKVVKSTAMLAFEGCKKEEFVFSENDQRRCGVTNDSYIYGFLVNKFSFTEGTLIAEFPHHLMKLI